jgi:Bacterial archaeo-eukaryotic release factor family 7
VFALLGQNAVKLLLCTCRNITEVELENVPASSTEELNLAKPEKQLQFHTKTLPECKIE